MLKMETQKEDQRNQIEKYLKIYNADINWKPHIELLKKRLKNKYNGDQYVRWLTSQVGFTILAPLYDKSVISDPPERLLFGCPKFSQFEARDWYTDLQEIMKQDEANDLVRKQASSFGFVYPIQYNPRSRQALVWLMDRVKASECADNAQDIQKYMENLVYAYGGAVICNVFDKPEYSKKVDRLLNWRSGYFFGRLIHEVYKPEEILKIKKYDIEEIKRSNPRLIKKSN